MQGARVKTDGYHRMCCTTYCQMCPVSITLTEAAGRLQVVTEYDDSQLQDVLDLTERMEHHLTAAVVSNDIHFLNKVRPVYGWAWCRSSLDDAGSVHEFMVPVTYSGDLTGKACFSAMRDMMRDRNYAFASSRRDCPSGGMAHTLGTGHGIGRSA